MYNLMIGAVTVIVLATGSAMAATQTFDVDANLNVWNEGKGVDDVLNTDPGLSTGITLALGETFQVDVKAGDTWNICSESPRCTMDADGIRPSDGNRIGLPYTDSGFTFNHGTLVGRVGAGDFFQVGTAGFSGAADVAGELRLYHWDVNTNNFETLSVTVTTDPANQGPLPVPLPASLGFLMAGLLGMRMLRKRT